MQNIVQGIATIGVGVLFCAPCILHVWNLFSKPKRTTRSPNNALALGLLQMGMFVLFLTGSICVMAGVAMLLGDYPTMS